MNWSEYSRFVGDIFGVPLAIEALMVFFLESTFLGIWIFGGNLVPALLLDVNPGFIPIAAILLTDFFLQKRREGWAFTTTALAIAFSLVPMFLIIYPRLMISSLNPAWSLTIFNAASMPYTLKIMTIFAVTFVPLALIY